jgi:hypothetical protein
MALYFIIGKKEKAGLTNKKSCITKTTIFLETFQPSIDLIRKIKPGKSIQILIRPFSLFLLNYKNFSKEKNTKT